VLGAAGEVRAEHAVADAGHDQKASLRKARRDGRRLRRGRAQVAAAGKDEDRYVRERAGAEAAACGLRRPEEAERGGPDVRGPRPEGSGRPGGKGVERGSEEGRTRGEGRARLPRERAVVA